jgi:cell division protein FtsI/penicillin-binding protein 2
VRLLGFVGVSALLTLIAFKSRGDEGTKLSDYASAKQKILAVDITRAQRDGSVLTVKDERGNRWPLTVNVSMQRSAHQMLAAIRPEAAALVAIEFATGRVVVLTEWPTATSRDESILLGRQFPAASVFKIVTTAALVERAHVSLERSVCTDGGLHRIGPEHLVRPHSGVVQCKPFSEALGYSRNAVFAQLASQYLKPEDLENYADRFGFGSALPLEIGVPFGQFHSESEPLTFARTATGFIGSSLSPLGAAYLAYVVASGGRALPLRLFDIDTPSAFSTADGFAAIRPETAGILRRMMEVTVRRGTCWRAFHDEHGRPYLPHIQVAGKTGTLGEQDTTYSWFIGFAPSQRPEIVLSVLLKNGPVWQKKANEIARDWLIDYFSRQRAQQKPGLPASPDNATGPARARSPHT